MEIRSTNTRGNRAVALIASAAALALVATMAPTAVAATPVKGGNLRVGVAGGGATDSLDVHKPANNADIARTFALSEALATYDTKHAIQMALAKSITPDATGKSWTVVLKSGLKFSDGSALTSAEVLTTFQRIVNTKKAGAESLSDIDFTATTTPSASTIVIALKSANASFIDSLASYANGIVPANFDPAAPVGAGPFKFKSFTAGQQSVFVKNPNYYKPGKPYLDTLTIIDFPDATARLAALQSGQVDAIDGIPSTQIALIKKSKNLRILESQTGGWLPFTMNTKVAPYSDARVRQALRLLIDRPQMIKQVLGGAGALGNDLYSPLDACYSKSLPQRKQNIAEATRLLKAAGMSNYTFELATSDIAPGAVEAATVFAQQAKKAGVTIKLKKLDSSAFWADYLKWPFAQSFWYTRDFLPQTAAGSLPTAPYNETGWSDAKFISLVDQARAVPNTAANKKTRCDLVQQAQKIEYDRGGHIIWGFANQIDAYSNKVNGLTSDKSGIPLTSFGFGNVWLSK
jgi:peptide/nickel transport system substrate-binding protein